MRLLSDLSRLHGHWAPIGEIGMGKPTNFQTSSISKVVYVPDHLKDANPSMTRVNEGAIVMGEIRRSSGASSLLMQESCCEHP